jgi:hypothetical protein
MELGLDELVKNQKQLKAASIIIENTFKELSQYFESNELKLLQALESLQQKQAHTLKEVGGILDGIMNKK